MATNNNQKLAVLIDADNAQASVIQELLAEVSRYGTATLMRAYGDWTTENLKGWKAVLHKLAIQPIQQFSYTTGKNSTDASLIIDAMDVLHTGNVDGFCLVSSDSDFTRLATRIREAGLVVYGFGERKTPEPFVAACDKFIYTEILRPKPEERKAEGAAVEVAVEVAELPKLRPMVLTALDAFGNHAIGYRGTLLFRSSDPLAQLPPPAIFSAADAGVHSSIPGIIFRTPGNATLTAQDAQNPSLQATLSAIHVVNNRAAGFLLLPVLSAVTVGMLESLTVTAIDVAGNPVPAYTGTLVFSSPTDPQALLPPPYTFTLADAGQHAFDCTFLTVGSQSLVVTDSLQAGVQARQTGSDTLGLVSQSTNVSSTIRL